MKKLKEQFKKDFEQANNVELSFDVTQLESNQPHIRHRMRPLHKGLIFASGGLVLALVIAAIPFTITMFAPKSESVKLARRKYNVNEIEIAKSNTFNKLNDVTYPNLNRPLLSDISEEENSAYSNFANLTYHSLVDTSKEDNMSYCVVGLYSVLNELTASASRDDLKDRFNNLLGLNETSRVAFYEKIMKANSFVDENATTQIKNAAFFRNGLDYSPSYVDYLTSVYCEAYQLDFNTNANKMVEWVNKAVNDDHFIDKEFLGLRPDTVLYLFSTLYFKSAWGNKYLSSDNINDDFFLNDGNKVTTKYMKHSYNTESYYDYDSYIYFKDYYCDMGSVTYIIPKKTEDNIFTLTKDINIFEEKEDNKVLPKEHHITVNLQTPKFTNKANIDFALCLNNLGFGDIYDDHYDSFHGAFNQETTAEYNFYLQTLKQRNQVEFNEDGTIVKSVTMAAAGGKGGSWKEVDTLDVKLNQPFIYIIRDANNTPIFVGHIDNPQA